MKQTPQHNNKRKDEKKGETKVQRELKRRLSTKIVLGLLNVEPEALAELQKIDRIEFDIFKLRDKTENNELVTVMMYLVTNNGLLAHEKMDF
jgi:hypothetical protein